MVTPKPRICMAMLAMSGGSSIVAQELGLGLAQNLPPGQGFEVRYCNLQNDQLVRDHFFIDSAPGVKSSQLLDIPESLGGPMDSVSELLRIHDNWPFDLLHLHNVQVYGLSAQQLSQLRSVPYVVTCHGSDILNPHLFDHKLEVVAAVLRAAAAVTCVSQHIADRLLQKVPDLINVHVINNFVRASWLESKLVCDVQPLRFLHVSSLRSVKRPEILLRAFARVQRRLAEAQLIIVTTSNGVKRLREMLKNNVHDGKGVQIINGDLAPELLIQEYARAQAFVLTSDFEGFGLVVLEALLYSVPVIAPAVGALPELLGDDWPYLVPDQQGESLIVSISDSMMQAARGSEVALQTRMKEITAKYHGPKQIAQYVALYNKVLGRETLQEVTLCQDF
jgi:glycosyltransferase involved in cell wall biosynthesis